MPDSVRFIILLVGLCLFLLLLVIAFLLNRNRDLRSCLPFLLGAVLLFVVVVYVVDPEKLYECQRTIPDQIILAGHIPNPDPNNYLVILYKGEEEIDRFVTRNGRFEAGEEEEEARDGYFEMTISNELGLTRCSMVDDFKQDRSGYDFFGLRQKTVFMWHQFADLEAGASEQLNNAEPKKTYTLRVLPNKVNRYPQEIKEYTTYLDRDGEIAVNLPIKTYTQVWNSMDTDSTEFSPYGGRLANSPAGLSIPIESDVRDAWVVDGSMYETTSPNHLEPHLIDRNNCTGSLPPNDPVQISSMYIHEVQFQEDARLNFNMAVAAEKAVPSLGFTQGQLDTIEQTIIFDVPVGIHRKYKVYWQDVWKAGLMEVDFGESKVQVPFRAKIGMIGTLESLDVECPG